MPLRSLSAVLLAFVTLLVSPFALAHSGAGHAALLADGFMHPVTGLDHLLIAIAAGVIDGLELGLNTRAALITRGMTEIRRLGLNMGANPRTFTGLAGFGDLILTCTGHLSRNHTVGKKIGQGEKVNDILGNMRMVAEGVKTAKSVYNLSRKLKVEMPISHETYRILYEDLSPKEAVMKLMTRDLKQELDED